MQAISRRTLNTFFEWILNQFRGKGGRRLAGIKSTNTFGIYWKVFRLVHERATGEKIQSKINRQMHRVSNTSYLPTKSYLPSFFDPSLLLTSSHPCQLECGRHPHQQQLVSSSPNSGTHSWWFWSLSLRVQSWYQLEVQR